MIRMIAKLLKVLNSETEPAQISLALCFSMIMGFTPLYSLHNILAVLLVLILRVNLSAFILGWAFFSGLAYLLDPLFHQIGLVLLTLSALEGLWTSLYNITLFRLENFNNSIVMGSLFLSLVFFVPLYLILNLTIRKYREHILAWIQKTRIMQAFKASKIYSVYQTVSGWRG
ncbi:MAG: DUF2062 domain-containing protein [Deltaproteobacteria bacterium]|nr:MAG: DUF2062 domain-containing protein [Deltaproteobacteria bacterium]